MKALILISTSLYGMTINDYYKVIEGGEKTVLIQQIGKIVVHDDGDGCQV